MTDRVWPQSQIGAATVPLVSMLKRPVYTPGSMRITAPGPLVASAARSWAASETLTVAGGQTSLGNPDGTPARGGPLLAEISVTAKITITVVAATATRTGTS